MPYRTTTEYVEPEIAVEHNGVKVYCTYGDHNDIDDGPSDVFFCLTSDEDDTTPWFDVRELPGWTESPHPPYINHATKDTPKNRAAWEKWRNEMGEAKHVRAFLISAIEAGVIHAGMKFSGD